MLNALNISTLTWRKYLLLQKPIHQYRHGLKHEFNFLQIQTTPFIANRIKNSNSCTITIYIYKKKKIKHIFYVTFSNCFNFFFLFVKRDCHMSETNRSAK